MDFIVSLFLVGERKRSLAVIWTKLLSRLETIYKNMNYKSISFLR